ncbi:MAG: HAMP domain-containing histidine kinase [Muribaculaceae bacterium]|nr:HAMP domain-containing histidine kinase [Muribaculaceae bacterium]
MGFDVKAGWHLIPSMWLLGAVLMAFCAGYCYYAGILWWIVFIICSICCGILMLRSILKLVKSIRYIMDATLNGDFSYKFPTANIGREEREVNEMLNNMVTHFELLSTESRQNEAFLERVINLTDVGLAVADIHGNIILHNESALRLLERPVLTHVCQIPQEAYEDIMIRKSELTVKDKSFTLFTFSDVSRQIQVAEVESWEKLTRVLTHEIMNSLTPIQSIAETMSDKTTTREASEAFETISSSSRSLMQFVRNFREFTKLPEPKMKVLYLKPLLESCVRLGKGYTKDKDIEITLVCFPPDVMVYTDEALLSRVLLNIIKNAVEANSSIIKIETDLKADESVEIRISNDGEPIPDEVAGQIFTPFFTTRTSGSGIGLSLSRRIITYLGGTLSFKTAPSTSFTLRL